MTKHGFRKRFAIIFAYGKEFYHRIPYFAIASVCIYLLLFVGIRAYYRYMPASWFIDIQGIPHIDNGQVGANLTLTFCRRTRYPDIKAIGARGFYLLTSAGHETPVEHYTFNPTFQGDKQCQYITLTPNKHPEVAGTYISHTDLTFYVDGHKKVIGYNTNTFVISDTKQSLEQQIQQLEKEIKALQGQELVTSTSASEAPSVTELPNKASASPAVSSASTPPTSTSSNVTPTSPATAPSAQPNIVQRLLIRLTGGLL